MSRPNSRLVVALCAVALLGTACSSGEGAVSDGATAPVVSQSTTPGGGQQSAPDDSLAVAVTPADDAEKVRPDQAVTVKVTAGTITRLKVTGPDDEALEGSYNADHSVWTGLPQLRPGADYEVTGTARGTDGATKPISSSFRTLTADQRLKASVSPLGGMTVGVAMPIQVFWNHPVKDKAAVERRLSITTSVPVEGTWHWNDDKQVNFRPKVYWPAHTRVTVNIDTRGVKAGDGLWGWANRKIEFQIGTSVVSRVDVVHHVMTVSIDGKVARRIPVTAGKDGFTTRSGNRVIMEKFRVKRLDRLERQLVHLQAGLRPQLTRARPHDRPALSGTSHGAGRGLGPWLARSPEGLLEGVPSGPHTCGGLHAQRRRDCREHRRTGFPPASARTRGLRVVAPAGARRPALGGRVLGTVVRRRGTSRRGRAAGGTAGHRRARGLLRRAAS